MRKSVEELAQGFASDFPIPQEYLNPSLVEFVQKTIAEAYISGYRQGKKDKQPREDFDASILNPFFETPMRIWLEYKKQRKQAYKGEASIKACEKKLINLSDNDPKIAMQIVEQSMANNWNGLFELRNNGNSTKRPKETDNVFDLASKVFGG